MKKIYTIMLVVLIGTSAFAQSNMLSKRGGKHPLNPILRSGNSSTQITQGFYCDYAFMDDDYQVNQNGLTYTRYIWDMNMRYDVALGDTSIRWAAVDFNPLYNSDYTTVYPFPQIANNSFTNITIDTIFFNFGHSNYSGLNDTILVKIVQCTIGGYPSATAVVLHTDTLISNVSLTGSTTWLDNATYAVPSNFFINNNTTKVGVRVEFYGSALDTFGMIAGFGDYGSGNCAANPNLSHFAVPSMYADNSYRHDMYFSLPPYNYQQLPTSTGADTYYDCDGVTGYLPGADSEIFLQNWDIWIHATTDAGPLSVVSTEGNNLNLNQNAPNPANGSTTFNYTLLNNSDVAFNVYDITGKVVYTENLANQSVGAHRLDINTTELADGIYFYNLTANGQKVTRKMVVANN